MSLKTLDFIGNSINPCLAKVSAITQKFPEVLSAQGFEGIFAFLLPIKSIDIRGLNVSDFELFVAREI